MVVRIKKLLILRILIMLYALCLAAGCATANKWGYLPDGRGEETSIYVVSHGWHTGVVVSKENLGSELDFLETYLGSSPFYEIGWGDKGFYQADEITSGVTLRALTGLSEGSVLHVVAMPEEPNLYFPDSKTIEVHISKTGHTNLNKAILESFRKNSEGKVVSSKNGIYGNSLFFEANGRYYIINTCNIWTSKVLNKAGVPLRTFLTLTASSVMKQTATAVDNYSCCATAYGEANARPTD